MSGDRCADCGRDGRAEPHTRGDPECSKDTITRLRAEVEALRGRAGDAEEDLDEANDKHGALEAAADMAQQERDAALNALAAAQKRVEGLEDLAYDLGLLLLREREYTEALARQHLFDLDDAEAFRLNDLLLAMVKRMKEAGIGPDTALKRADALRSAPPGAP